MFCPGSQARWAINWLNRSLIVRAFLGHSPKIVILKCSTKTLDHHFTTTNNANREILFSQITAAIYFNTHWKVTLKVHLNQKLEPKKIISVWNEIFVHWPEPPAYSVGKSVPEIAFVFAKASKTNKLRELEFNFFQMETSYFHLTPILRSIYLSPKYTRY
jgi:hypothetical protein